MLVLARARLFQKGLSLGPARARPGLVFLGLDPSLYVVVVEPPRVTLDAMVVQNSLVLWIPRANQS